MDGISATFLELLPLAVAGLPFAGAILAALLIPVVIFGARHLTERVAPAGRLLVMLSVVVVGSALTVALSGRTLVSEVELLAKPWLANQQEASRLGSLASQLATILLLTLAATEWLRWLSGQLRVARPVRPIWLGMLVFFCMSIPVSAAFGHYRNPSLNVLYAPFVFTAAALLAQHASCSMWNRLRWVLVLPCAASLVGILLAPNLVQESDYKSLLPGFTTRLHGVTEHANSLGMLAAIGLFLEMSPFVRRRPHWVFALVHLTALVLAQSKTAWVAAALGLLFIRKDWLRDIVFRGDRWRMVLTSVVLGCMLVALGTAMIAARSEGIFSSLDSIGAFTLTGRTDVWRVSVNEFIKSPLVGYGPSIWDLRFRTEHGLLWVGQAHNQFMQTLGQSGALGLLSLLVYLSLMAVAGLRHWHLNQGFCLVVFLALAVRCVSESPMRMTGVMGYDSLFHMFAFVAAVGAVSTRQREVAVDGPLSRSLGAWR